MLIQRVVVLTALVLSGGLTAFAHVPTVSDGSADGPDRALVIDDPSLSQVVYHEVGPGSETLWLSVAIPQPRSLFVQVGIPLLDRLASFRPAVAILGPGLPEIELPFEVPAGLGGVLFETTDVADPPRFDEPFSGTSSWILFESTVDLPEAGDYFVVAFVPSGESGKLWLAIGEEERFELDDILELPAELQAVRAFHEIGPAPVLGLLCPGAGLMLFVTLAVLVVRRR